MSKADMVLITKDILDSLANVVGAVSGADVPLTFAEMEEAIGSLYPPSINGDTRAYGTDGDDVEYGSTPQQPI